MSKNKQGVVYWQSLVHDQFHWDKNNNNKYKPFPGWKEEVLNIIIFQHHMNDYNWNMYSVSLMT